MRITRLSLHVTRAAALLAAATPGFAQGAAPVLTAGGAAQVVAATPSTRATNLQRQPIVIDFASVVALQDRAARGARTAIAGSGVSRPGRN